MLSFNRSTGDKQRQNQVTTTDVGEEAKTDYNLGQFAPRSEQFPSRS